MPRMKVFCTTSGFYDTIVAAPSKPAALKAWGAKTDLFSMGIATVVSDPKIAKKALERPGEVIRLKRSGEEAPPPPKKVRRKPPNRKQLEAAEKRLRALQSRQATEREQLDCQLEALEKKRASLKQRHDKAIAVAEQKLDAARAKFEGEA